MPIFARQRRRLSNPNNIRGRRSRGSLTASGYRVTHEDADQLRRLVMPWQSRAFAYYDLLGEIKYASQFYARMLSPLRLYPAIKDENGDLVETTNAKAVEALERIQDPGGGRTGLLGTYGRLMFLTGECYLLVTRDPDTELEQWEMLSMDELRIQSGVYTRYRAPSLAAEDYREPADEDWEPIDDDTAIAYRLWQRHPRFSMLADSTMMGVLDLCEELVLLTQAVRARARSRLAGSGLLLLDERISPSPPEPVGDEDPEEDIFVQDLTDAITSPITNEGAASAVAPIVIRCPVPEGKSVKDMVAHIQIIDPTQLYPETGLRYECIKRIAIGLDMPPQELTGFEDSNHWTGWLVDEQTWKAHGQPKAQQFCDDLTAAYFRPYLRQEGVSDAELYCIAYDAAAIINHPDRTKDAKDLYDRRSIGKKALRDAAGFKEDDAPTPDELNEMIGVAVHDGSLALFGEPSVKTGGVEIAPGDIVTGATSKGATGEGGAPPLITGAETEKGPPAGNAPEAETVIGSSALAAQVLGAAQMALLRTREAAGNRLKGLAKRDDEMLALLEDVPARDVAAALGLERARALKAPTELELVSGSAALIAETLGLFGIKAGVAALVAAEVEKHAARTLYQLQPAPLPANFLSYVNGLLSPNGNNGRR